MSATSAFMAPAFRLAAPALHMSDEKAIETPSAPPMEPQMSQSASVSSSLAGAPTMSLVPPGQCQFKDEVPSEFRMTQISFVPSLVING
jgi:hypothetical protein